MRYFFSFVAFGTLNMQMATKRHDCVFYRSSSLNFLYVMNKRQKVTGGKPMVTQIFIASWKIGSRKKLWFFVIIWKVVTSRNVGPYLHTPQAIFTLTIIKPLLNLESAWWRFYCNVMLLAVELGWITLVLLCSLQSSRDFNSPNILHSTGVLISP